MTTQVSSPARHEADWRTPHAHGPAVNELATLTIEDIQMRENRWVIADLSGKGKRVRTMAIPVWVKNGFNAWQTAARIEEGKLIRSIRKGGKVG